ncbi:hypothetical protein ACWGHU_10355 [Streptomyces xanthophaeus]
MSASRFASLSVSSRQWMVESYTPLITGHTDRYQRAGLFIEQLLDGCLNGELCPLEYVKAVLLPAVLAYDTEMVNKLAALITATDGDGTNVPPPPVLPGDQKGTKDGTGLACGGHPGIPGQRALFPLDIIDARIEQVRSRLGRIDIETARLRQNERDSRTLRSMMEDEKLQLQDQLKALLALRDRPTDLNLVDLRDLGLDEVAPSSVDSRDEVMV